MSRNPLNGFTLVELLVAIAIFSLLMTAASGSLLLGSRSLADGATHADRSHELRSSVEFLRRQFAHLTPLVRQQGRDRQIAFAGERDAVQFVAPAPDSAGGAGLVAITLKIDGRTDDSTIQLAIAPVDPGGETWFSEAQKRQVVLAGDQQDIEISYFGAPYEGDERSWHREWRSDSMRFPELVRLVARSAGDASESQEFRFPIHVGQSL